PNVVSTGMGLKNLSARYLLICNQDITIENNTNYFTVKIPVLNE
ncbi:histidine kinase, partial [Parabacteroides distasonis]|nr:histidine kinase [Parabacteroides distasonis]